MGFACVLLRGGGGGEGRGGRSRHCRDAPRPSVAKGTKSNIITWGMSLGIREGGGGVTRIGILERERERERERDTRIGI